MRASTITLGTVLATVLALAYAGTTTSVQVDDAQSRNAGANNIVRKARSGNRRRRYLKSEVSEGEVGTGKHGKSEKGTDNGYVEGPEGDHSDSAPTYAPEYSPGKGKGGSKGTKSVKSPKSPKSVKSSPTPQPPPEPISMTFRGYQNSMYVAPEILPSVAPFGSFSPGTSLVFANEPIHDVDEADNVGMQVGRVQGNCFRTDPNYSLPGYEGRGYCQFTYEFFDTDLPPTNTTIVGTLSAEGAVGNDSSSLVVTSGSGGLYGATGLIILSRVSASIDGMLEVDTGLDFLERPNDGYLMEVEVDVKQAIA